MLATAQMATKMGSSVFVCGRRSGTEFTHFKQEMAFSVAEATCTYVKKKWPNVGKRHLC